MVIDIIRSDELRAKNCKTIFILEAIIFKMESKMAEFPLTLYKCAKLARIYRF